MIPIIIFISVNLFVAGIYLSSCLHATYLYQIKEYRRDRLIAFFREEGIFHALLLYPFKRPAVSIRNILIIGGSALLGFAALSTSVLHSTTLSEGFVFYAIPAAPVIAWIAVSIMCGLTGIGSHYKRIKTAKTAQKKRRTVDVITIGITGSYGKTSVKEFLYAILSKKASTAKTDENNNTLFGVSRSFIKNVNNDTRYFIAEMGAYRTGEIREICEVVHPQIGIITALGNQHVALFGSVDTLRKAKKELAYALPPDGTLYINAHIDNIKNYVSDLSCRIITYGYASAPIKPDLLITNISPPDNKPDERGLRFHLSAADWKIELETQLLGNHNILNIAPAAFIAHERGVDDESIRTAVSSLQNLTGKLSIHNGINGSKILNDVYSSNVAGFCAAIKTLSTFSEPKKYILTRGLIELGTEKKESYKKIVEAIRRTDITLLTTDPTFVTVGIGERGVHFHSDHALRTYITRIASSDTLFLIEGRFPDSFVYEIQKI